MPKRRQDGSIDVYVRVPASYTELLADLQAIPARARAGRLRLLATLALRAGSMTATTTPLPPNTAGPASESAGAVTPKRRRVNALKGSLFS